MAVFLACLSAFAPTAWAKPALRLAGKYSGGTGEPNDPYRIANAEDLNDIGNHNEDWDKHFILVNDVNLAAYTGTQFNIVGNFLGWGWDDAYPEGNPFTGVFDGNYKRIWNFTWSSTGRNGIGLFGYLGAGGQIKNLGMENVDVNAVAGWNVGGLAGENNQGTIINCYSTGRVMGDRGVGGLVGENCGTINSSYSSGSVDRSDYVGGGLVGKNGHWVEICLHFPPFDCFEISWPGSIHDCYSLSNVKGNAVLGGLVGENSRGEIADCYSTGSVTGNGNHVGGLLGYDSGGAITASFWDMQTSGQSKSAGGTGKTTAEMKTMSTFTDAGWDFVEIWGIGENQTYPYLRTEPAGDSNHDGKIDLLDLAILASHWLENAER